MQVIPLENPETVHEAVHIIISALTIQEIADIKKTSRNDFVLSSHFCLGADIRNSLVYQNSNFQLLKKDCLKIFNGEIEPDNNYYGIHEDEISECILEKLWEQIRAKVSW